MLVAGIQISFPAHFLQKVGERHLLGLSRFLIGFGGVFLLFLGFFLVPEVK